MNQAKEIRSAPKRALYRTYQATVAVPVANLTEAKKRARKAYVYEFEYQQLTGIEWQTIKVVERPEFHCSFCKARIYGSNKDAQTYCGHVMCSRECVQRYRGEWPVLLASTFRAEAREYADGHVTITIDEEDEYNFASVADAKASAYWPLQEVAK
jgi:hypothetical protein